MKTMTLAEHIRNRRVELELSVDEAAEIAGITPDRWGSFEGDATHDRSATESDAIRRTLVWTHNSLSKIAAGEGPVAMPRDEVHALWASHGRGQIAMATGTTTMAFAGSATATGHVPSQVMSAWANGFKILDESSFSSLLRSARTALGMKQRDFGMELGVTEATISRWEHGRNPDSQSLSRIEKFLAHRFGDVAAMNAVELTRQNRTTNSAGKTRRLVTVGSVTAQPERLAEVFSGVELTVRRSS
jgi:transcriptional regulator with XRE-family HTH domain